MNIFTLRRNRLMNELKNNACVILFSGKAIMKTEDESYDFFVNRNFITIQELTLKAWL